MPIAVRSNKAGSTTSFATSFSLGNTLAIADLDTDLDNLVAVANNNEAVNIATGAVGAAELDTNAVTTVKILDANVTTAKIANFAVTNGRRGIGIELKESYYRQAKANLKDVRWDQPVEDEQMGIESMIEEEQEQQEEESIA